MPRIPPRIRRARVSFLVLLALASPVPPVRSAPPGSEAASFLRLVGVNDSLHHPSPPGPGFTPPITRDSQPGDSRYIVPDPIQPDTYWTASWGGGIWKSTDGGRTWVPKNNGLVNLMIDAIHIDSSLPAAADGYGVPYMYAAQSPLAGTGNGYVYRSRDGGESWEATAVCQQTFGPISYFHSMESGPKVATLPGDGPRTVWATQSYALENCGLVFRSQVGPGCARPGDCWCSFSPACNSGALSLPQCANGTGEITGNFNDGTNVIAVHETGEVYFLHEKARFSLPCRNSFRDTLASQTAPVDWKLFDRWAGPTSTPGGCLGRSIDRLRAFDIAYDPLAPEWRFASHVELIDCDPNNPTATCASPFCAPICGFTKQDCNGATPPCVLYATPLWGQYLGYSSGNLIGGDLQWENIVDLMDCFGLDHKQAHTGLFPILFRTTDGGSGPVKEVFARYRDVDGTRLFYCDASASDADCRQLAATSTGPGWKCIYSDTNRASGCASLPCAAGTAPWGGNVMAWKMTLSRALTNGHHEALLQGRRKHARTSWCGCPTTARRGRASGSRTRSPASRRGPTC